MIELFMMLAMTVIAISQAKRDLAALVYYILIPISATVITILYDLILDQARPSSPVLYH